MFGFRNFTGFSFVGKVNKLGLEFTLGLVEEMTFNITGTAAANAAEIPENIKFISKDHFIANTSAVVSSNIVVCAIFELIASATPNLII